MDKLSILLKELNTLPRGYISKKTISGKTYYYHQFKLNGQNVSKYIKPAELSALTEKIERRKEIENEIKRIESSGRNITAPATRAMDLTGSLMMADRVVATFEKGLPVFIDPVRCPLLIKRTGNLRAFLASRAIDRSRTHSRLLKKYLQIKTDDDAIVSIYSYGATITDNYWFKAKGSKLKYEDITFDYDYYSDLALKGDAGYIPRSPKFSPQLTLTGSYEKCWKNIDGEWYLYKQGSDNEYFSEMFCSKLAKMLGVPSAQYELIDGYIRTKNIAEKYNLEPISSIAGDDDSFENVFNSIYSISPELSIQYLRLILFDYIIYNVDRHNENCGLMRSRKSGKIMSLAPNYDNNIALLGATSNLTFNPKRDGMITYLMNFLKHNEEAAKLIKEVSFNTIYRKSLQTIFDSIKIKVNEDQVAEYVLARYQYIMELIKR